ncbi:MAG: PEP-CTERM sorting domain-containing protein [Rubrivivax sp.]|nr:PEP-CTERM sorting domain-containing protein [Rubrivivax sp.]
MNAFACCAGLMLAAACAAAQATAYTWAGGPFSRSGVPGTLEPPDTALMQAPVAPPVFDTGFHNRSVFSYRDSNLAFADGVTVINDGTWVSLDDHGLLRSGSPTVNPRFVNFGLFRKDGGGPTLFVNLVLVNSGEFRAQQGTIALNSPFKTFNEGSVLHGVTGLGRIEIRNGGRFNGGFSAENLELVHGDYDGDAAVLTDGRLDWTAGAFTGSWTNRATMVARDTGGVRQWGSGVSFTNAGSFVWESGVMTLGDNARLVNTGTYRSLAVPAQGSHVTAFDWIGSAVRPTVTNRGRFVHAGLPGLLVGDVHFVNFGTIEAERGPIAFNGPATFEDGTRFEGNIVSIRHSATFKGRFETIAALILVAGTFDGQAATMSGRVQWRGGTLANNWTNEGDLAIGGSAESKAITGTLVNGGEIAWISDSDVIHIGEASGTTSIVNRGSIVAGLAIDDAAVTRRLRAVAGATTQFDNSGSVVHLGLGTTEIGIPLENTGAITVHAGRLRIASSFEQRGTVALHDAVLELTAGPLDNFGRITGTGAIEGTGFLVNHGHIAPGLSPGTLALAGGFVQAAGGVFELEVQDRTTFDRLLVGGEAVLQGGELALHCLARCDLAVGDRFDFLVASGGLNGTFDALTLHGFGPGWSFDLAYGAGSVQLVVLQVGAPIPEPGRWALLLAGLTGLAALRRTMPRQ